MIMDQKIEERMDPAHMDTGSPSGAQGNEATNHFDDGRGHHRDGTDSSGTKVKRTRICDDDEEE